MKRLIPFLFLSAAFLFAQIQPVLAANSGLFDIVDILGGGGEKDSKPKVSYVEGDKDAEDEILIIKIKGIIKETDDSDSSMPFEIKKDMMDTLVKDLAAAKDRPQIKAVLLEIDSPGGEITASDIMYHKVMLFKACKKPVFALIGMMGASGAYYVACAADQIWAHPTSIIGSIGVIIHSANLENLAKLVGYRDVTMKSDRTPKKDMLSPFREMSPEERKMILTMIDGMYDRFVKIVAESRKKKVEEIVPIADGGIYTADQAKGMGLIDGIAYRDELIETIKKAADLKSAKFVKRKTKKGIADFLADFADGSFLGEAIKGSVKSFLEEATTSKFLYQLKGLN